MLGFGPIAAGLSSASAAQREAATRSVREAFAPYVTPEGIRMQAGTWIVSGVAG
jgi:hypothetical protein